jgi:hypothetical protein
MELVSYLECLGLKYQQQRQSRWLLTKKLSNWLKIIILNSITGKISNFNCLGCDIFYAARCDTNNEACY